MDYAVEVKGQSCKDDGLRIPMQPTEEHQAWYDIPLPRCPDCGGDLVWYEAGYVPGTRKCMGEPIGGRPTNPLLDTRVPLIDGKEHRAFGPPKDSHTYARARALLQERNECADTRVAEIDDELCELLYPWMRLAYEDTASCGSLFSVQQDAEGVFLRRERFY